LRHLSYLETGIDAQSLARGERQISNGKCFETARGHGNGVPAR